MAKTILITGASSGVGLECAKLFLDKNYDVVSFDLNLCPLKDVQSYIVDIRNEKDIKMALQTIKAIDVVVQSAGVFGSNGVDNFNQDEFDAIIDTNLKGSFLIAKNTLHFLRKTHGSMIFVSCSAGMSAKADAQIYSATKAGLNMLAKCLTITEKNNGVRINTIIPGLIGKSVFAKDVANAIVYLSEVGTFTGTFMELDNGESVESNLPIKNLILKRNLLKKE